MGKSLWSSINELRDLTDRIIAGEFPQRSPLGPGIIQSKNIRARAITAPLINVSNLEAVNTKTGDLNVDGTITVSTAGKIVSGTSTTDFTTFTTTPGGGLGYYLEYDATYGARMAVGDFNNVTGQYMKWDGLAMTIKGVLVASSGVIAGWTITTDSIENSGGTVGMASSGHSGYSFWAGDATPASAKFSVTSAGALVASSATITGAITASSGSITGVLTVGGSGGINLSSAGGKIYSGQSALNTGSGFHLSGSGTFSVGNGGSKYMYWDGSALIIRGTLNANDGTFLGNVTIGNAGSFSSGQSAYDTGTGFWLEYNTGTPRFSIGNSAGNKLTWNGTTLAITGTLTSTAGTIGGWTIDSAGLRTGSGATTRGMDTGSTAFYAGSATPGSAPFRVSSAGALVATSATLTGAVTASSLSITGTASFSGGSMTLPGGGTITSSTMDLNSGTMAGLTIDGTLTMASGGKILLNSAGRIEDADGSYWDQGGITMVATGVQGDRVNFKYSGWASLRPYSYISTTGSTTGASWLATSQYGSGAANTYYGQVSASADSTSAVTTLQSASGAGPANATSLTLQTGSSSANSNATLLVHGRTLQYSVYADYATYFGGRIYPGPETGSFNTTRYISDANSRITMTGQVEFASATTGGSNANWSTFTVANIPDKSAAYVVVYINGTAYRIPLYGNA